MQTGDFNPAGSSCRELLSYAGSFNRQKRRNQAVAQASILVTEADSGIWVRRFNLKRSNGRDVSARGGLFAVYNSGNIAEDKAGSLPTSWESHSDPDGLSGGSMVSAGVYRANSLTPQVRYP
jgi:hypothetical protein